MLERVRVGSCVKIRMRSSAGRVLRVEQGDITVVAMMVMMVAVSGKRGAGTLGRDPHFGMLRHLAPEIATVRNHSTRGWQDKTRVRSYDCCQRKATICKTCMQQLKPR